MGARRVGIVTINDDTNYGNRLQAYALHEAIRALDRQPEILANRPPAWDPAFRVPRLAHDLRHDTAGIARRLRSKAASRLGGAGPQAPAFLERRRAAIRAFARQRLTTSPQAFAEMPAEYWSERYAAAIAGSDQVWNPTYRRAQGIDFLDFVAEPRRIAYAPSFGVAAVPGFLRHRYREWLRGIPHLSVRESVGRRIVSDLTGRDVPVVLDPTALVDRSVWDALIAEHAPIADRPYAMRFFLGHPTPAQESWMQRYAAGARLAVVDLHALDDERYADVDPGGFVAAISRAEVVFTDSFHAALFALRYRRPLVLGTRYARDPRRAELIAQHGLRPASTGVDRLELIDDVDWTAVDARREQLRTESWSFLRGALEGSAG